MVIKRFDAPEPKPEDSTPKSRFDPFAAKETENPLGKSVYKAGEAAEGKYNKQDLLAALIGDVSAGLDEAEKLMKLYGNAIAVPTRSNVDAYQTAVSDLVGGNRKAATVVSILISTFVSGSKK